jgi:hypothetical protein
MNANNRITRTLFQRVFWQRFPRLFRSNTREEVLSTSEKKSSIEIKTKGSKIRL